MLDGTLFFVKSARYGKPKKDASSAFFFVQHGYFKKLWRIRLKRLDEWRYAP